MTSKIVVPGEMISETPKRMAHTYIENNKTYSTVVGMLMDNSKLVPMNGPYEALSDDYVVGVVVDVKFAGYNVNLNSPYGGFLSSRETRDRFELGDVIFAKVVEVDEVGSISLGEPKKLTGGRLVPFTAVKVPRLIGKKNSMVNMIKEATGCEIFIGRNGMVWVKGKDDALAIQTIMKVEEEAHISGLTDRINEFLKKNKGD